MPRYRCPQCETVLKKAVAIPEGKKIKCPKCDKVFAAEAFPDQEEDEKPAKAKPAKPKPEADDGELKMAATETYTAAQTDARKALDDEEEEGAGVYMTVKEEETAEAEKPIHYGSLRDKFAKSKKGPAMVKTLGPSNLLTAWGFILAAAGVVTIVFACWPYIFSAKMLSKSESTTQLVVGIMGFMGVVVGAMICWGSSKLQSLESYPLAWLAAVLGLPIGILAIIALSNKDVIAGFEEVADPDGEYMDDEDDEEDEEEEEEDED